jgi:hypothetical protein
MFLEIATKEHIPRKYANSILPTKTEFKKMLSRFSIFYYSFAMDFCSHTKRPMMINAAGARSINPIFS